jgi:hypothetical protein
MSKIEKLVRGHACLKKIKRSTKRPKKQERTKMNQIYSYDEGKQWIHKMAKEASEDKKICSKVIVDLAVLMLHMKY